MNTFKLLLLFAAILLLSTESMSLMKEECKKYNEPCVECCDVMFCLNRGEGYLCKYGSNNSIYYIIYKYYFIPYIIVL